jgi:hypothetical protein
MATTAIAEFKFNSSVKHTFIEKGHRILIGPIPPVIPIP